jgi:hypothetical protein
MVFENFRGRPVLLRDGLLTTRHAGQVMAGDDGVQVLGEGPPKTACLGDDRFWAGWVWVWRQRDVR